VFVKICYDNKLFLGNKFLIVWPIKFRAYFHFGTICERPILRVWISAIFLWEKDVRFGRLWSVWRETVEYLT